MESVSVLKNNTLQTVPLPRSVAFPDAVTQVDIIALGRARLIVPAGEGWDSWFDDEGATDDFMVSRDHDVEQQREAL